MIVLQWMKCSRRCNRNGDNKKSKGSAACAALPSLYRILADILL